MKIIYLHQYFKKPNENGGTRSFDLAHSFVKEGHKVDMVTTTSTPHPNKDKLWLVENVNGINVHYLFLPYDNSFTFLMRVYIFIKFIFYSTSKILKLKGDVLLATSTPLTIGVPALIKKFFHGTPFIFEVRDVWPEAVAAIGAIKNKMVLKALYKLEYLIYLKSKCIVPLSVDMHTSIVSRYPKFKSKIVYVVENIAETNRFKINNLNCINPELLLENKIGFKPKVSILYAGTFGKVNNISYVLNLADRVSRVDQDIIFLLLGSGTEKNNLVDLSLKLEIYNKNLFFLNPVNKEELPSIYAQVTFGSSFVAPIKELWANSANKYFDTLASGKPIIINHLGWQSEEIISNKIGIVLPSKLEDVDIEEFVKKVNDFKLVNEFGERAREIAVNKYSLEAAIKKYNKILSASVNN